MKLCKCCENHGMLVDEVSDDIDICVECCEECQCKGCVIDSRQLRKSREQAREGKLLYDIDDSLDAEEDE